MTQEHFDQQMMQRCLTLARQALGYTSVRFVELKS